MARQFADVLGQIRGGMLHEELTLQTAHLVSTVIEHGKPARLTLTIDIRPNGEGAVLVSDKLTAKEAEPARGSTVFFATPEGSLVRHDPRQPQLPLREVAEPEANLKEMSDGQH